MRVLHHIGIPTTVKQAKEGYSEDMRLFITDPADSINKIEFLRFEKESTMPELIQTTAHVAYQVEDIVEETKGKKIVYPITKLSDNMTIAFIEEDGIAIELIELS